MNDLFAIVVIAMAAKRVYQITVLGSVTTTALHATRLQNVEKRTMFEALWIPFILSSQRRPHKVHPLRCPECYKQKPARLLDL
jgi:hypothetical protein